MAAMSGAWGGVIKFLARRGDVPLWQSMIVWLLTMGLGLYGGAWASHAYEQHDKLKTLTREQPCLHVQGFVALVSDLPLPLINKSFVASVWPYVEQGNMYAQFDQTVHFYQPPNTYTSTTNGICSVSDESAKTSMAR